MWALLAVSAVVAGCSRENDHDRFVSLIENGTASNVPELIRGLQRQGDTKPDGAMVCTKSHCLEALRFITNQNPGVNYADWQAWWDANGKKPRAEWIRDGFRAAGLPVVEPPDEAYARALIHALGNGDRRRGWRSYLQKNALDVLKNAPCGLVDSSAKNCLDSKDRVDRLGAIACIWELVLPDAKARLRNLNADADADVRESALSALNGLIRKEPPTAGLAITGADIEGDVRLVAPGATESQVFIGTVRQVGAERVEYLLSYDGEQRSVLWERRCPDSLQSPPAISGDKIFFTCHDGKMYAASSHTGETIWKTRTEEREGWGEDGKPIFLKGQIIVPMERRLWSFRQDNGEMLWNLEIHPVLGQAACVGGKIYVLTKNRWLLEISSAGEILRETKADPDAPAHRADGSVAGKRVSDRWGAAICADDKRVYVFSGYPQACATAYSTASLAAGWEMKFTKSSVLNVAVPFAAPNILFLQTDRRQLAVDCSSGRVLWSTMEEHQNLNPYRPFGDRLIGAVDSMRGIEFRDLKTGETTAHASLPDYVSRVCATGRSIFVAGFKGKPWILKMPEK